MIKTEYDLMTSTIINHKFTTPHDPINTWFYKSKMIKDIKP